MFLFLKDKLEISHGKNKPMLSMEGLRGLAVFLVFLVHYSSNIAPWMSHGFEPIHAFTLASGSIGVDLFFVLSGYLIYKSIMSAPAFSISRYAKARVRRIYPPFLCVFALYLILSFLHPAASKLPETGVGIYILQNILLMPGIFFIEPMITVAWSLSYEALFYFLIPIAVFGLKLREWTVNKRIAFWLVLSVVYILISDLPRWEHIWDARSHLSMFVAGILLHEIHTNKGKSLRAGATLLLVCALLLFGLRSIYTLDSGLSNILLFLLLMLFCLGAFNKNSLTYKWLTFKPLRWLGNMSYSYYLIHGLALKIMFFAFALFVPESPTGTSIYLWLFAPAFIATLLLSFLLFLFVERPFSLLQPDRRSPDRTCRAQFSRTISEKHQ